MTSYSDGCNAPDASQAAELTAAFAAFNEVSQQLQTSYQALEGEAGRLRAQLQGAQAQRIADARKLEGLVERHRRLAALGEMAAALAHQIRTPLAAALLYATNASRPELAPSQRDGLLVKAVACLHDLEHLVGDMLQFARGASLAENRFALNELLDSVETTLRPIVAPGQTLAVVRIESDTALLGNREALAGALLNLATNALTAGGAAAQVAITAAPAGLEVDVRVTDNGPGIEPALVEKIFEPFFTSRPDGTGLGLAVARSVARSHGGELTLADTSAGRTTFALRLPTAEARQRGARFERTVAA